MIILIIISSSINVAVVVAKKPSSIAIFYHSVHEKQNALDGS